MTLEKLKTTPTALLSRARRKKNTSVLLHLLLEKEGRVTEAASLKVRIGT